MTKRKPVPPVRACASCKHFNTEPAEGRNMRPEFGECRRYPPFLGTDGDGDAFYYWPTLPATEWCGEFSQRLDA